jgi:hypothetical protein
MNEHRDEEGRFCSVEWTAQPPSTDAGRRECLLATFADREYCRDERGRFAPCGACHTPATTGSAQGGRGIGEVPGYPEWGAHSWRAANDEAFAQAAAAYNKRHNLSPGNPGYFSPHPPPHDFFGHLIGAECPVIGGVHDGEEGGARPFLLAA